VLYKCVSTKGKNFSIYQKFVVQQLRNNDLLYDTLASLGANHNIENTLILNVCTYIVMLWYCCFKRAFLSSKAHIACTHIACTHIACTHIACTCKLTFDCLLLLSGLKKTSYVCIYMRYLGHRPPPEGSPGLLRSRLNPSYLGDRSKRRGRAGQKETNAMRSADGRSPY